MGAGKLNGGKSGASLIYCIFFKLIVLETARDLSLREKLIFLRAIIFHQ